MITKAAQAAFFMLRSISLSSFIHAFGIACYSLAWLSYDHYRPWVNFHGEALAVLALGLIAWSRCIRWSASVAIAPRITLVIIAVAAVPWVQFSAGISLFTGDAVLVSLYLFAFALAIWLGYGYVTIPEGASFALSSWFSMLWVVALITAAIGLVQWLNLQEGLGMYVVQTEMGDRAMGNFGQPNQFATFLLLGLSSLLWAYELHTIGRTGLIAGVVFFSVGLVLSQSRAGLLSAVCVAIFLVWKNLSNSSSIKSKYVFIGLLLHLALWFSFPYVQRLLLLGEARGAIDNNLRATIWKQVVSGITQSPWVGFGWNETPSAHAAGSLAVKGSLTFTHAHNIVLDLLAWNGVPLGSLIVCVMAYWVFSRMYKTVRCNAIYAMSALIPIGVHSMVEYPFAYAYFFLAAGVLVGIVEGSLSITPIVTIRRIPLAFVLAFSFALGMRIVYEYFLVEEDFRVVRFENLRIGRTPADYAAPTVLVLTQMSSMLRAARQEPSRGMSQNDLDNLRKASTRFAYGALRSRYALALGLNGDPMGATRQLVVIRGMYGESYYNAVVITLRDQQREKYPELSLVREP